MGLRERANHQEPIYFHVEVTNPALADRTIEEIRNFIGRGFIASRILSGNRITSPTSRRPSSPFSATSAATSTLPKKSRRSLHARF